jgi:hypothetical protein
VMPADATGPLAALPLLLLLKEATCKCPVPQIPMASCLAATAAAKHRSTRVLAVKQPRCPQAACMRPAVGQGV